MSPVINNAHYFAIFYNVLLACLLHYTAGDCRFPSYFAGEWFSMDQDKSVWTTVTQNKWGSLDCVDAYYYDKPVPSAPGQNATYLLFNPEQPGCYYCQLVLWRTPNVLQLGQQDSRCNIDRPEVATTCFLELPYFEWNSWLTTYFRAYAAPYVNCAPTFEGVYHFTYEQNVGGGGICDNTENVIKACQVPNSAYIDNEIFRMDFANCSDVTNSFNKKTLFICYGTWDFVRKHGGNVYTFAAIADAVEKDPREKYRCLMTYKNQTPFHNKTRWVMSRFADCSNLHSIYNGPVRLVLKKQIDGCPSYADVDENP